jgi:hypothetical protein
VLISRRLNGPRCLRSDRPIAWFFKATAIGSLAQTLRESRPDMTGVFCTSGSEREYSYLTANLVTGNLHSLFIPSSILVPIRLKNAVSPAKALSGMDLSPDGLDLGRNVPCIYPGYQGIGRRRVRARLRPPPSGLAFFLSLLRFPRKINFSAHNAGIPACSSMAGFSRTQKKSANRAPFL